MADEGFNTYFTSRPAATLPLSDSDAILVLQGSIVGQIPSSNIGSVKKILLDTSGGPANTLLPTSGIICYIKSDDSGNAATLIPSVGGQTVMRGASVSLTVQDEFIVLELIGSNWYRVG